MRDQIDGPKSSNNNDEIDLRELFLSLWRGKYLIFACIIASIIVASLYLRNAERKYSVNYVFKSVASDNAGPNFAGLGGLASLAGVSLPTSSSSDFLTFQFLLYGGMFSKTMPMVVLSQDGDALLFSKEFFLWPNTIIVHFRNFKK